jgi:S-adenosylmethionine synthetase
VYAERERAILQSLQEYADAFIGGRAEVTVLVNSGSKSGRPYLVTGGSCVDFGEEGAVGRGNKTHGIIASFRPNTMEAPHGKNPTYFVGKVLGYQADLIARRIYDTLQTPCQVVLHANMGDSLFDPASIIVSTEHTVSPLAVESIIATCLSLGRATTNKIINEAYFLPRTASWKQQHD